MDSSSKRVRWQFYFHLNNIWVGGIGSTARLLFKHFFPVVVAVNFLSVVSIPVLFSGSSQQEKTWFSPHQTPHKGGKRRRGEEEVRRRGAWGEARLKYSRPPAPSERAGEREYEQGNEFRPLPA